jgi:DNA-binding beta-propeller fold protein YncE
VTDESNEEVHIWSVGSVIPMTITLDHLFDPWGLFVTIDGSIYIGSETNGRVEKWTSNGTKGTVVMNVFGTCAGLFVDIMNHLYCSLGDRHQVVKQSLDNNSDVPIIVAGNGTKGSTNNMLDGPRGIFVTTNLDLYVADCWNDRIQFFKLEQRDGITVTESISTSSINLRRPTGVFLDADGYLFIVDNSNHRIIGSRSNGFYCVVGCSSVYGSTSSHLYYPYTATFDSYGNIFVSDQENNRIQKFKLMTNTSSK